MEIIESKLINDLTVEQKLEIATRALCSISKAQAMMTRRQEELIEAFEVVLQRLEAKSWEKAINAELERRGK